MGNPFGGERVNNVKTYIPIKDFCLAPYSFWDADHEQSMINFIVQSRQIQVHQAQYRQRRKSLEVHPQMNRRKQSKLFCLTRGPVVQRVEGNIH